MFISEEKYPSEKIGGAGVDGQNENMQALRRSEMPGEVETRRPG